MAKKTEKLTNMAYDQRNFKSLEAAIENVNTASLDTRINTDNKELQGIENALNHLLDRMRETYRQQSRFVSDASHELRTPIAVIRGYADMLDRWGKEDESILDESIEAIKMSRSTCRSLWSSSFSLPGAIAEETACRLRIYSLMNSWGRSLRSQR